MRTTLAIDEDVLNAAKAIARQKRKSVGEVISDLARRSLAPRNTPTERNGVPLLNTRHGTEVVTLEIVNALRDETM